MCDILGDIHTVECHGGQHRCTDCTSPEQSHRTLFTTAIVWGALNCTKFDSQPQAMTLTNFLFSQVTLSVSSNQSKYNSNIITPHAQRERGKVIGRGVHICIYIYIYIYICLWSKKIFESYFRDRLTFSNVDSRTSR